MKIKLISTISFIMLLSAVFVYAFTYDTDGGFNIWVKGTCIDNAGNYTDYCSSETTIFSSGLLEYFPINGTGNSTYCSSTKVNCRNYNSTCINGTCV